MTISDPRAALALAAEFEAKRPSSRFLGLADAPVEVLTNATPAERAVILAALLGEDSAQTASHIEGSRQFTPDEIGEGVRLNHLIAAARGELAPRIHQARGTSGLRAASHAFLVAACERDFDGIIDAFYRLPLEAQGTSDAMAIAGYAFSNRGRGDLGDHLMDLAVSRLAEDGNIFLPSFWLGIRLLMDNDPVAQSRLLAQLVRIYGEADPATAMTLSGGLLETCLQSGDNIRLTVGTIIPVVNTLLRRASQLSVGDLSYLGQALLQISDAIGSGDHLASDAYTVLALSNFIMGRTQSGLEFRRLASRALGEHRDLTRIFSAPLATPDDLAVLESVSHLWRPGDLFEPLDPMARVEGRPVANAHRPCETWCAELNEAEVISGDTHGSVFHYVLTAERHLLMDGLNLHPSYHVGQAVDAFRALSPTGEVLVDLSDRPSPRRLAQPALLVGGVANYYHWLMEYLPRVGIARDAGLLDDDMTVLVNAQPAGWQSETLDRLGIPPSRLSPLVGETTLSTALLVVPSLPSTRYAVDFLRRSFLSDPTAPHRVIYVARLDCDPSRSRIANEIEVARAMQELGADILVPGEATFAEQVRLFSEAKVVVGPHGAGLTNIAFCPTGAHVLEIVNSINADYVFFEQIAKAADLKFQRWTSDRELPAVEPENAPSIIDIARLVEAVQALLRT